MTIVGQKALARRGDNELPFVNANLIGGQGLLLVRLHRSDPRSITADAG
jgi:hypothetical protein